MAKAIGPNARIDTKTAQPLQVANVRPPSSPACGFWTFQGSPSGDGYYWAINCKLLPTTRWTFQKFDFFSSIH